MRTTSRRPGQAGSGTRNNASSGHQRGPAQPGHQRGPAQGSYSNPPTPARPKNAMPAIGIGTAVLLVVIAVAILLGIAKNADQKSYYSNNITAGVEIDGANVSGQDADALKSKLKKQYEQKIKEISIKLTYEDKSWALTGADLGVKENVDDIVSQAALLARTGSLEQRRAEAKQVKTEGREFTVKLSMDDSKLKIKLNEIASQMALPGRDASVVFMPDNVDFTIPKDIEDLDPSQNQIDKMFVVNAEAAGQTVDVDMMTQKITEDLKDDWKAEQQLIVDQYVPQQTEAELRQSFHLLNAYRTKLSSTSTDERISNIELALSKFNGFILYPGEELSFNDTTGPRTEANGYKLAPTIGSDKSLVDDFGGGVCQASTTLYNAALMSGCEVTDRGHHSIPSSYALKGFDAMVNYPSADLKFKNTSDASTLR